MTGCLSFPYQIDAAGHTATTDLATYVENLVVLVLETTPGERVNRPEFGAGLRSLVFAGMDNSLASAAQTLVRSALIRFLGNTITIQTLTVSLDNEAVTVALTYVVNSTQKVTSSTVNMALPGSGVSHNSSRATARISGS